MSHAEPGNVDATTRPERDWPNVFIVKAIPCQATILLIVLASFYVVPTAEMYFREFDLDLPYLTQLPDISQMG